MPTYSEVPGLAFTPTIYAGDRGKSAQLAILALQRALHHSLGRWAINLHNGGYGSRTIADVERWKFGQHKKGKLSSVDGRLFGPTAWRLLKPNIDHHGRELLEASLKAALAELQPPVEERRKLIVATAIWTCRHESSIYYQQRRPIDYALYDLPCSTDCSGHFSGCYKINGAPDPNGLGYNGDGYTGTLWAHGRPVGSTQVQPGDAMFYGSMEGGEPSHVVVVIDRGSVVSHGSEPGPIIRPAFYRSDYRGARTYNLS